MAEFRGYECDNCGNVLSADQTVKHTEKFEGAVEGQFKEHLCIPCAQKSTEGKDLSDLPRRKSSSRQSDDSGSDSQAD